MLWKLLTAVFWKIITFSMKSSNVRFDIKWFLFVFPAILSIIPMLCIIYIIDTDPSITVQEKKQLGEAPVNAYMPFDLHLALVLSCSMIVACVFWYCLIHLKNPHWNSVDIQNSNYRISCRLYWTEKGKASIHTLAEKSNSFFLPLPC